MTRTHLSHSHSAKPQILKRTTKAGPARGGGKATYLFDCWATIDRRVQRARQVVVFLDFDGTLVRLRRKPKDVFLAKAARRVLQRLVSHRMVTLCFISGRQLRDLQQRVQVEGAIYFGLHGWERSNGQVPDLPSARRLRTAMQWVQKKTHDLPGIRVEDKGICFGVHYRTAGKQEAQKARAIVKEVLNRLGPNFSLMSGKKIWEIYPKEMGSKGTAAKQLLRQIPNRKLAIYAGDDTTDETAFALLRNGVTIRIGKFQDTRAKYFLRNPSEVLMFLERLEKTLT